MWSIKTFVHLQIILNTYFSFCDYWMCFNFCFCFFNCYLIVIASTAIWLEICTITAWFIKYKSVIKKKRKKHDKITLITKTELNDIEVLNSRALTDSYISDDEFLSVSNVLKECNIMKDLKTSTIHQRS